MNGRGRLEDEVRELRRRVGRLERALAQQGVVLPEDETPETRLRDGVVEFTPVEAASFGSVKPPGSAATGDPTVRPSFETQVGSQWFNRIGIIAVLVGVSWFLKLAVDRQWIAPGLRVLIGLGAGAGLIGWSERFRTRGYTAFSYSLKSVGSGVLYLTLWAAFSLFHLVAGPVAFAGMVAVTGLNGFLAWRQDAELLAFYAIAGGLGTPLLVSTGGNHEIALFSYLLILDAAVLALMVVRSWTRLLFAAFAGTAVYVAAWWLDWYAPAQSGATFGFLLVFFLLFALAPRVARIGPSGLYVVRREGGGPTAWDRIATVLLPVSNAGLGFLGLDLLLRSQHLGWAEPCLALGCTALYLGLAWPVAERAPARSGSLRDVHLATAITFLTIAIPLAVSGHWMTIGWLAEGAGLLWVATRTRSGLPRVLGLVILGAALLALIPLRVAPQASPAWNSRFATYLCAIAACGITAWGASRVAAAGHAAQAGWQRIGAVAGIVANGLILITALLELHTFWAGKSLEGRTGLAEVHSYAQFSYSAACMGFGAVLLAVGFWRGSGFLRWQALVILALAVGKVFAVDTSQLSQGYRILSFLGLGVLLLGVSFVYQRDWLGLRSGRETS